MWFDDPTEDSSNAFDKPSKLRLFATLEILVVVSAPVSVAVGLLASDVVSVASSVPSSVTTSNGVLSAANAFSYWYFSISADGIYTSDITNNCEIKKDGRNSEKDWLKV